MVQSVVALARLKMRLSLMKRPSDKNSPRWNSICNASSNMTISMAFIAPALVKAAIEGRLPRGIGVAALRDAPAEWSLQFERLGLAQP